MWQHRWAILGGILGATASCLAKIAVSSKDGPLVWIQHTYCEPVLGSRDLDEILLSAIYRVLGDLMVKYRINLMPYAQYIRIHWIQATALQLHIFEVDACQTLFWGPRLLCLVAMLVMNAYMLAAFLKGMQHSGSVVGMAITTACNFATSALWGALVWKERFASTWWMGFACVLAGVVLLSSVQSPEEQQHQHGDSRHKQSSSSSSSTKNRSHTSISYRASNDAVPNSVVRKYGDAISKYGTPLSPAGSIDASPYSGGRPSIRASQELLKMTASLADKDHAASATTALSPLASTNAVKKIVIQPNEKRIQQQRQSITPLTDRTFSNECPLCDEPLFDPTTGEAGVAVADLSPSCYHLLHARCLKYQQKISPKYQTSSSGGGGGGGNASKSTTCPICEHPIPMFINAKQAAHFGGFWIQKVEKCLRQLGPVQTKGEGESTITMQPQPASAVREWLKTNDKNLTEAQKRYIDDDPTGLGKGLSSALEWGGSVDYNDVPKGHKGWHTCLQTRGIWQYSARHDDVWLWEWKTGGRNTNTMPPHPRQRCDQCQLWKETLPVSCQDCQGSSEAAYYCSEACQKRDKQRHKMTCQMWQQQGPSSRRKHR